MRMQWWGPVVLVTALLVGSAACTSAHPSATATTPTTSGAQPSPGPGSPTAAAATGNSSLTTLEPSTPVASTTTAKPAKPLAGKVIVVDPGHDGGNAAHPEISQKLVDAVTLKKPCDSVGTQDATGYPEHRFTWQLGQKVVAELKARGATVVLTRGSDTGVGPCMTQRSAIANKAHADAVLTLHADGAAASGHGFHVIRPVAVGPNDGMVEPSFALAAAVHDSLISAGIPYSTYTGARGYTTRSDLGGLNLSTVPKIFIEFGNMKNPTEAAQLRSAAYQRTLATALADGVTTYVTTGG